MRLDKYLAQMGAGTRSEIKKAIRAGRVTVNGEKAADPAMHVRVPESINKKESAGAVPSEETDEICLDGVRIAYEQYVYYLMNKPAGVISATEDPSQRTVLDLIDERQRKGLFPVGRLDKDTEGLLLITNDGELAHRLLSPKRHVDKVYFARLDGPVGVGRRSESDDPGGEISPDQEDVRGGGQGGPVPEKGVHGAALAGWELGDRSISQADRGGRVCYNVRITSSGGNVERI